MRTEQLISIISADDTAPRQIGPRLVGWGGLSLLACGAVAIALRGVRPHLAQAMADPVALMKWALPLGVGAVALIASLTLSRPQTRRVPAAWVAAGLGLVAAFWLVLAILGTPPDRVWPIMRGQTALTCLMTVTGISVPTLAVVLVLLRDGASPAPAYSGALAGLGVGGLAAFIYAFRCDQDQPLFFLTWYGLGMIISMVIGGLAGRRLLRW
ncbi:NrsF family protein [Paracoccus homiensis]|uniref:DUF1109 domain-containing protein n=1 Tax=Paracoccus homiensis TaxID=364199 RepID=A0A1I0A5Q8_9RHOB|nr:DUF1109 domain-containing protein [Paracoccus homiensis]SES89443.1 hypothetical protein SAMN04489858_102119 [Paracoccus homiensis]